MESNRDSRVKEIRYDEETIPESAFWIIFYSVMIRIFMNVIYRDDYYLPFMETSLKVWQSRILYFGLIAINLFIFFVVLKVERNYFDSIRYSVIPPLISLLVYYFQTYKMFVFIMIAIISIILIVPVYRYIEKCNRAERLHKKLRKRKVKLRLFRRAYNSISYIALVTVVLFALLSFVIPKFGIRGETGSVSASAYEVDSDSFLDILDQHKDELMVLQKYRFSEASKTEKLDALQTLLNCETSYLKIEPITLIMQSMDSYKAGYYDCDKNLIFIRPEDIVDTDDPEQCINSVLHEGRHAYQRASIDYIEANNIDISLPIYADEREWKKNYENYVEFSSVNPDVTQYIAYRNQPLEVDSYSFAARMTPVIQSQIESW
ncbi:MAG: hypothetical protein K6B68_14645 [Eubacterium sp.]|nr:hypothetical protein [Eubacterium sp.]